MSPAKSDETLLAEFLKGRKTALVELAHRYEAKLLGLAQGMLGQRSELAHDAIQETWLRVIRFGAQFNGNCTFKTWLYRIAINRCHDLSRMLGDGGEPKASDDRSDIQPLPEETAQR